jgi:hypothetical protein
MRKTTRLSRNFHNSFKPERHYITAMLRFAASGAEGDAQTIAAATGIPTGTSSGKVPAILNYCLGMGLLKLDRGNRSAIKKPELTTFGRTVLLEDPYLKTGLSQWIAHLNLCSPIAGADVWYHVFFRCAQSLGISFERSQLESHLSTVYGVWKPGIIGPLIGMYQDEAAFRICGALVSSGSTITRTVAPIKEEYGFAYGAWLLQLIDNHFPEQSQITTTELDKKAGWYTIPGWDAGNYQRAISLIARKGMIEIDRHMEPWLIRRKMTTESAWMLIFDDVL